MTDFGTYSRQKMMKQYHLERRKRNIRRFFYHALDAAGFIALCFLGVLATACLIFVVYHR